MAGPRDLLMQLMGGGQALDPTELRRFIAGSQRNKHVDVGEYNAYLRKGIPRPPDKLTKPLDLSTVQRKGSENSAKLPEGQRPEKGRFREFMALLEAEAAQGGHDSVYVENILNEFLPEILQSMGYVKESGASLWPGPPSMFKRLR